MSAITRQTKVVPLNQSPGSYKFMSEILPTSVKHNIPTVFSEPVE